MTVYRDEDGATYRPELSYPEGEIRDYSVDLVRQSVDDHGLAREQRLTLAHYPSQMAAEEHLHELQAQLDRDGLQALADDAERLREQPFEDVFYLTAVYPPDAPEGDDRSAVHLLAIHENGIRTAEIASGEREPLETLAGEINDAFSAGESDGLARAQVERGGALFADNAVRHVDGGGTAHHFDIVESQTPETSPYELRYFRELTLPDGTQHADSHPVMPLVDDDPGSAWALPGLEMYLQKGDVFMAQQFAHDVADAYGQAFPAPHDLPALDPTPEYYFGYGVGQSGAPSLEAVKTWMDGSERRFDTFTIGEYDSYDAVAREERPLEELLHTQGVEVALNTAEALATARGYLDPERDDPRVFFNDDAPPDPFTTVRQVEMAEEVRYSIGAISANGAHFLDVVKVWGEDEYERLAIPQPTWEDAHLQAEMAFTDQHNGDLQGAMRRIEGLAEDAGILDPDRVDGRLFTQGPPDPFETRREVELAQDVEVENPYWRLDTLPVNAPDGSALGYALHCTVFPEIPADDVPAEMDDSRYPSTARRLEMAHFETREAAEGFGKEFEGYLLPGVLEGPELAREVARLEGLPVEWKTLEGDDLTAYQNLNLTLTRDPADWHPYNPNAERDARMKAEGLYTDPIQQFVKLDEEEDELKIESVSPDFDL